MTAGTASPIRMSRIARVVWAVTTISLLGAAAGCQDFANQQAGPAEVAFAPQVPPPIARSQPARVIVNLEVTEQNGELARGVIYNFWMYNGHVPGPFIRVRVGDTVEVHLKNRSSDKAHTVDFHFVSGPGGGAPVLMAFVRRLPDYRHQVLEISPPVPMDGDTATAFGRCVTAMDGAIRASPAEWDFWFEPADLASLGLLRDARRPATVAN